MGAEDKVKFTFVDAMDGLATAFINCSTYDEFRTAVGTDTRELYEVWLAFCRIYNHGQNDMHKKLIENRGDE
jgi:hypothetical protein